MAAIAAWEEEGFGTGLLTVQDQAPHIFILGGLSSGTRATRDALMTECGISMGRVIDADH